MVPEIKLLFGELVLQGVDFLEGQCIFNGDGDLRGDLLQELHILRGESIVPAARRVESAKGLPVGDQRDATHGLHACGAKGTHDFVLVTVNLRAAREERLAVGNRLTGGRSVAGNGDFRLDEALVAGKIKRVNLEQPGLGIEEREASVVVVDDALQSFDDAAEKVGELAAGDQDIVDFEKNPETVALTCELRLIGLGSLEIKGVIDRNGHLAGDALHELQFGVRDALRDQTAESHGAEAVLGGRERKNRERPHIMLTEALQEIRKARLLFGIADHKGLLRLPDPTGGVAVDGRLTAGGLFAGDARFQNVEAHDVA